MKAETFVLPQRSRPESRVVAKNVGRKNEFLGMLTELPLPLRASRDTIYQGKKTTATPRYDAACNRILVSHGP
jgi:hypothetical protein